MVRNGTTEDAIVAEATRLRERVMEMSLRAQRLADALMAESQHLQAEAARLLRKTQEDDDDHLA